MCYGGNQFSGTPQQHEKVSGPRRTERVVIQRGRDESFVLIAQNNAPDADLARAITVDDVIERVRVGLAEMFERKEKTITA